MSRVITFSEFYPKYHPKAGIPTYFPQKILAGLDINTCLKWAVEQEGLGVDIYQFGEYYDTLFDRLTFFRENIKHHTIRRGNRWKVGDWFSPRLWSGKPYRSKQIQFAPDIQVKKVWSFSSYCTHEYKKGNRHYFLDDWHLTQNLNFELIQRIANNDGLESDDFMDWISKDNFDGQIICWNDKINY